MFKETIDEIPCVKYSFREGAVDICRGTGVGSWFSFSLFYRRRRFYGLSLLTRLINTSTFLIGWYEFLHEFLFHDIQLNFCYIKCFSSSSTSSPFIRSFACPFSWPVPFIHSPALIILTRQDVYKDMLHFISFPFTLFCVSSFQLLSLFPEFGVWKILKFQFKNNKNIFCFIKNFELPR